VALYAGQMQIQASQAEDWENLKLFMRNPGYREWSL
jgi:hypothetical protein